MDKHEFIKQFSADSDHEGMVNLVYDQMVDFCQEHDLTREDISTEEIEQAAQEFVRRGFNQ